MAGIRNLMKIAVLTYDHPHRKTADVVFYLKMMGFDDIELLILPWEERKAWRPLYAHRPANSLMIWPEYLCDRLQLQYHKITVDKLSILLQEKQYDKVLIGGAGVLPGELVKHKIINAHGGYLPNVRGLDALKWAILNGQPIGVTTHFIGEGTDTGVLIDRKIIHLYPTDSFHSIAYRVYETEVTMLCNAVVDKPSGEILPALEQYQVNRRMLPRDEIRMMNRLNLLLQKL